MPSITTLLEALKIVHVHGRLRGRSMISMSCSGGEALMISDMAEKTDLEFRALSPDEKVRIKATTHDLVTVDNPFDYHTFDWGKWDRVAETYTEVLRCGFDLSMLVLDFPRDDRCDPVDWTDAADALRQAVTTTGERAAIVSTLPDLFPEDLAASLLTDGIVPLFGLDDALRAVDACGAHGPDAAPGTFPGLGAEQGLPVQNVTEWDAKQQLSGYGISVPNGIMCATRDEAVAAFESLKGPVVAKAVGEHVLHKTELGAVKLGLTSRDAVGDAFDALSGIGEAVLIECMAGALIAELIVGIRRDPIVGLYLLIGSGGVTAELIRDTQVLLLPASASDIREAVLKLQLSPLLTGYRGRAKGDVDAVVSAILALQSYALEQASSLEEVEINPLFVHAEGHGATAVDALMRVRETRHE